MENARVVVTMADNVDGIPEEIKVRILSPDPPFLTFLPYVVTS
jgi:hypothetical protein